MTLSLEKIINGAKRIIATSLIGLALNAQSQETYKLETRDGKWDSTQTATLYFQSTTGSQDRDLTKNPKNRFENPVYFRGEKTPNGKLVFSYLTADTNSPPENPATVSFNSSYIYFISGKNLEAEVTQQKVLMDSHGKITLEEAELKEKISRPLVWVGKKILEKADEYDPIKKVGESSGLFEGGFLDIVNNYYDQFEKESQKEAEEAAQNLAISRIPMMARTSGWVASKREIGSIISLKFKSENAEPVQIMIHYDLGLKRDIEREFGRIRAYTELFTIETKPLQTEKKDSTLENTLTPVVKLDSSNISKEFREKYILPALKTGVAKNRTDHPLFGPGNDRNPLVKLDTDENCSLEGLWKCKRADIYFLVTRTGELLELSPGTSYGLLPLHNIKRMSETKGEITHEFIHQGRLVETPAWGKIEIKEKGKEMIIRKGDNTEYNSLIKVD